MQAGIAFGAEPDHPTVGALPRDTEFLGDVSDWSALVEDT
jgi:hypothetical protein